MARLTAGEARVLHHYLATGGGRRLRGPFTPLTPAGAHTLAPTLVPAPPPTARINRFGVVAGGQGLLPPSLQLEAAPIRTAEDALESRTGIPKSVASALQNTGLLGLVEAERLKRIRAEEPIHADPLAEAAIGALATAGISGVAGLGRGAVEAGADALGAGAADTAAEAAPRSVAQILRDATQSVRNAPQAAREGVEGLATRAGQRAAAEKVGGGAADYLLEHPKVAQVGGLGAAGAATGKKQGGLAVPTALLTGTAAALNPFAGGYLGEHDINTAEATARGVAGAVTAPAALLYAAGDSAIHGTPNPFLNTAKTQGAGLGSIFGNLLSGDPATVQKATEHEAGLLFAPGIPHLADTDLAGRALDTVRDTAKAGRGALNRALQSDVFRYGPEDQHVFGLTERRAQRRATSEEGQRASEPHVAIGHFEAQKLRKAARKIATSRRIRNIGRLSGEDLIQTIADIGLNDPRQIEHIRSRFTRNADAGPNVANLNNVLDAVEKHPEVLQDPALRAAVEEYRGIQHRTPQHADATDLRATYLTQAHLFGVRDAADRIPKRIEDLLPDLGAGRSWSRKQAWDYISAAEQHSVELRHAANRAAEDARVAAERVKHLERDERKRQIRAGAQVVTTDEPRRSDLPRGGKDYVRPAPKERGPNKWTKRLEESAGLQRAKSDLVDLQAEARGKRAESKGLARHIEQLRKGPGGKDGLNEYTRPEHAVSSRARRKLWSPEMVKAMVDETKASAAALGYDEPIFTHHGKQTSIVKAASGKGQNVRATAVQHVRAAAGDAGSLAARDRVDRSFAGLVEGSIEAPRRKAGLQEFARKFFPKHSIKLNVKVPVKDADGKIIEGKTELAPKTRMTEDQYRGAIESGQISSKGHVWIPESEYKQPFIQSREIEGTQAAQELDKGIEASLATKDPGSYGVVLPEERWKEYQAQVSPERGLAEKVTNLVSKGAGRILLFSPAWVETQAVAELLPMIMAHPELLYKAPSLDKAIRRAYEIDPNAAKSFAAVAGESPVRSASASELAPGYQSRTHGMFSEGARAFERTLPGRILFSTAQLRPLIMFDQWRQGKYRQILAAAELDKQLNGWTSSLQGMLHAQKSISDDLKGRPLEEQIVEIGRNPRYAKQLDDVYKYGNDIMGNWTAFSRFERKFGPAAIFYGFLRYAFRWPLTFARRHPLSATINYFLAQQNANQLEKILGGKPASFAQYADPVTQDQNDQSHVLVSGSRISPGLAAPAEGLLEGNAPQAASGSANPVYGALAGLFTGIDGFGGHDEHEGFLGLHWGLATKELMTTPPVLRLLGVGASHSQTSEELRANDSNKLIRSFAAPYLEQTAEQAKKENDIIKGVDEYQKSKSAGTGSSSGNPFEGSSSSSSSNPFESGSSSSSSGNPFE